MRQRQKFLIRRKSYQTYKQQQNKNTKLDCLIEKLNHKCHFQNILCLYPEICLES